jgi:uncharacterized protein YbjT (DUF2867 family)
VGTVILVTGAGGNVGSAVVEELRRAGAPVRAAYHSAGRAEGAAGPGVDAVVVDFAAPDTLPPAFEGVDALFLLGAMSPAQTEHELAVVAAARAAGVGRVVKLSVWRAPDRLTPIARLHRPVEEALEAAPVSWTFLRPNFYMQNFTRQMAAGIRAGVIAQPESRAPISFVDARDVARAAATVLTTDGHDGRAYRLTGPQALTFEQVAQTFTRALGHVVRFDPLTDERARAGMLERGLPRFYADALIDVSHAYRDGGAEGVTADVQELTGRPPRSLEQFIADHRAAFR